MNRRVLIIEDDKVASELLCRMLQRHHVQAESAYTFEEGLVCTQSARFDLAIVDLSLPPLHDPHATFERLEELGITSIVLTGVEDPSLIRECQRRQLQFILKPIVTEEVLKIVLQQLEWTTPSLELENALIASRREIPTEESKVRRPRFDGTITLGNVLTVVGFVILFATAFIATREDTATTKLRVWSLEDHRKEDQLVQQKLQESLVQLTANQGKIAATLDLITANYKYEPAQK